MNLHTDSLVHEQADPSPQTPYPREPLLQIHRPPNSHAAGTDMYRSNPTYTPDSRVPPRKTHQDSEQIQMFTTNHTPKGGTQSPRAYMERTYRLSPPPAPLHIKAK